MSRHCPLISHRKLRRVLAANTCQAQAKAWANPRIEDVRRVWTHDPAIRENLPTQWMKDAYDRWKKCFRLGKEETDLYADWILATRRENAV